MNQTNSYSEGSIPSELKQLFQEEKSQRVPLDDREQQILSITSSRLQELQDSYQQIMGCTLTQAELAIHNLTRHGLLLPQIEEILKFIERKKTFFSQLNAVHAKDRKQQGLFIQTKATKWSEAAPHRALLITANDDIYLNFSKYTDPLLGKGSFKKAKLCCNLKTGQLSVKITQIITPKRSKESVEAEVNIAQQLGDNPYIVGIEPGSFRTDYSQKARQFKARWITPFCNGGDLKNALKSGFFSPKEKELIATHLLKGVAFLHEKKIIHSDLKPANVFLEKNAESKVTGARIGDFGFAFREEDLKRKKAIRGTLAYMAPELLNEKENLQEINDKPIDCWALGCILYELYHLEPLPWLQVSEDAEKRHLISSFQRDNYPLVARLKNSSDPIEALIYGFLDENRKSRMTLKEALDLCLKT